MTRLLVIDPSLQRAGGHNLEYAAHLLHAARAAGYQVSLATHRSLSRTLRTGMDWTVLPVFHFSLYRNRLLAERPALRNRSWRHLPYAWQSQRLLRDFRYLFRLQPLARGDIVFLPMASGFELSCLVRFLAEAPWTRELIWCVQFHYDPLGHRGADVDQQAGLLRYLSDLMARVPRHGLFFYATTAAIAARYRALGLRGTRALPYPADPGIQPLRADVPPSTLNLVLAGHLRREKGPHRLTEVVQALWHDFLANGRIRLYLQGRPGAIRHLLPAHARPYLDPGDPAGRCGSGAICRVPHPLSTSAYREYIRQAQIGLMLYDQRAYEARCSGALVEFLCAGIPVVVPAGTWLSDQISEPLYQHHESILANADRQGWTRIALAPREGNLAGTEATGQGPQRQAVAEALIPPGARALLVQCHWDPQEIEGDYLKLEVEFLGVPRRGPRRVSALLGRRAAGPVSAMFFCREQATGARLAWSVSTPSAPVRVQPIRLFVLTGDVASTPPLGAVGLSAADPAHAADCVADMAAHYAHYRATALRFSCGWRQRHSPQALLHALEEAAPTASGNPPVPAS